MENQTPTIREDVVASLTPAELGAALIRIFNDVRRIHPGITNINPHVRLYAGIHEPHVDWSGHGIGGACAVSCDTYDQLIDRLALLIGDPAKLAQKKRDEAAKLIKEADVLTGGGA